MELQPKSLDLDDVLPLDSVKQQCFSISLLTSTYYTIEQIQSLKLLTCWLSARSAVVYGNAQTFCLTLRYALAPSWKTLHSAACYCSYIFVLTQHFTVKTLQQQNVYSEATCPLPVLQASLHRDICLLGAAQPLLLMLQKQH